MSETEQDIARSEQQKARHTALVFLYWLVIGFGLVFRAPAVVLFGAGCLLIVYLPPLYAQAGVAALSYRTSFSEHFAWPGDTLRMTVELENRGFWPVSLLQVWDELPDGLHVAGGVLAHNRQKRVLQHAFTLGMWQRVRRHYSVDCLRRGVFAIGPTRIDFTGPLGYGHKQWQFGPQATVVVYPRLHSLETLAYRPLRFLGTGSLRSFLHEDPLRLRGVRDYLPGDPLNRINWKATAHHGRHMVHIHEPSAHISVQFLLNLANSDQVWLGLDAAETEWAIEVTASLGVALLDDGGSVGVSANDYVTDLSIGAGGEHLQRFLESLARANRYALWKASTFVAHALEERPAGTILVLVTPNLSEELSQAIELAQIRHAPLRVVYTGSEDTPFFDHESMHWLPREVQHNVL